MNSFRISLSFLLLAISSVGFAQSDVQKPPQSEAKRSFETMKTLAGNWEGKLTTTPPYPDVQNKMAQVTIRVTSTGNAFLHEVKIEGRDDDPITMFYVDSDRLMLTHYCDAGNRPRMTGKMLPDGKTIAFDFLDIGGDPEDHMHGSRFTILDANHHVEEWTFMMGDKPVVARFDLQRKN